jgi:phage-related baseplate assembly protein
MGVIDLRKLPMPRLIDEKSIEKLFDDTMTYFKKQAEAVGDGMTYDLGPSSPVTKIFEVLAYREYLMREQINRSALSAMLPYAEGEALQNLVALFNTEREFAGESDERLRQRALEAIDGLATAGSRAGYQLYAKKFAGEIAQSINAYINLDAKGEVFVAINFNTEKTEKNAAGNIEKKPVTPEDIKEALKRVNDGLQNEQVRPLTDKVTVLEATRRHYKIGASIKIRYGADQTIVFKDCLKRLDSLLAERFIVGQSIYRSSIISALHTDNVEWVTLTITEPREVIGEDRTKKIVDVLVEGDIKPAGNEIAVFAYDDKTINYKNVV